MPQFFVPLRRAKPAAATLVYKPQVLGCAQVYYNDSKTGVDLTVDYSYLVDVTDEAVAVNWPDAEQEELADSDLEHAPAEEGLPFRPVAARDRQAKSV